MLILQDSAPRGLNELLMRMKNVIKQDLKRLKLFLLKF